MHKYAVIVFYEGNCLGQWGFDEKEQAERFAQLLVPKRSFGGEAKFAAGVFRRETHYYCDKEHMRCARME